MKTIEAPTLKDGLTELKISKTSYFRWRQEGRLCDEIVTGPDGQRSYRITLLEGARPKPMKDNDVLNIFGHKKYKREWIEWREAGIGIRPWSKTYKRSQLEYIDKYFERYELISAESLQEWIKETPPVRQTLRRHKHSCVSSMARFLYEVKGVLTLDEYAKIKVCYPRKSPEYEPKQHIIYPEDLKAILEYLPDYYKDNPNHLVLMRTIIIVLSESALRISELMNLTVDRIRFSRNIKEAYMHVKRKGGKWQKVPFSLQAQEAVREYMATQPRATGENPLFWVYHPFKKQYTTAKSGWVQHEMDQIQASSFTRPDGSIAKLDIKFTPHSFRHYCITKWANDSRIPITLTQYWAGHANVTMTQKYIHMRDDDALFAAFA